MRRPSRDGAARHAGRLSRGIPLSLHRYVARNLYVSKLNLEELNSLAGFIGAALVDSDSGMALATAGGAGLNLDLAAAGNTEVIRAKRRIAQQLGLGDAIEDVLISLSTQYHLIRPLESNSALFLYVVLDRAKANLAMARHELKSFEKTLDFS
jgi:predicted regulator of Ras-like GTPase activity (Roadblock/LC7/MglB family)